MNNIYHVQYQERVCVNTKDGKETFVLVVDTLMSMDYFLNQFMTPETVESLLTNIGEWQDNGESWFDTKSPLEHRVVRVVCPSNFEFYNVRLEKIMTDDELNDHINKVAAG